MNILQLTQMHAHSAWPGDAHTPCTLTHTHTLTHHHTTTIKSLSVCMAWCWACSCSLSVRRMVSFGMHVNMRTAAHMYTVRTLHRSLIVLRSPVTSFPIYSSHPSNHTTFSLSPCMAEPSADMELTLHTGQMSLFYGGAPGREKSGRRMRREMGMEEGDMGWGEESRDRKWRRKDC